MLRRFAIILMFGACFCLAGGHWMVLQTVAWAEMIHTYSIVEGSVWAGLERTFSGEAPCAKCLKIQEGQRKERQLPALVKADKKAESPLLSRVRWLPFLAETPAVYPPPVSLFFPSRTDAPPHPVPIPC